MYYGKRDKLISVRVSSKLLNEFQAIIDANTKVYSGRGNRNIYYCSLPVIAHSSHMYQKFSIADLLEESMKKFVEENGSPEGAK